MKKINKINTHLARVGKKKREMTQTTKFSKERGSVTINLTERKRTVKAAMNNYMPTN